MEEDLNTNLLVVNQNLCEINNVCKKCITTKADARFLIDRKRSKNIEFLNDFKYIKRTWKVPWFLSIISFFQILFFCIANNCFRQHLMFMPDNIYEYWRCITYMLLHSDVLHISMNVCLQMVIGFCLESEQGHLKVACIYVIGGVAGSLATFYLQPQLSLMGASAGVYAILMSHIPHLQKNFYKLSYRYLRILAVAILFVSDVCFTTFHVLINHNANPRICLEAHVAGAIGGLVFGFLIYSGTSKQFVALTFRTCSQNV